jgi:two-component system, NarL family, nitrate/nitrite response regulator NarP
MSEKPHKPIEVVLADPNPLILSAMSEKFSEDPRFSLVSTVVNAESFISTVMRLPVDLGIVCWNLPQLGGEKIIEILRDHPQAPKILVYSQNISNDVPRRALAAGAAGYCGKDQSVDDLLNTSVSVAMGKMVFPFMDIRELQADPLFLLTKRERVLLQSLANGLTNKELSEHFGISINTVKFHLSNLYEKLEVRNRSQAIAFFYSRSLDQNKEPEGGSRLRTK